MKIAMWSGPRNLSTAMLYAFGNRSDFAVWDEPFYAPYLAETGAAHPMGDRVVRAHESDPMKVVDRIIGSVPDDKPHWYMKHMPHHMLEGFPLDWAESCVNVHLIRHPARVVASYAAKRERPTLHDVGFAAQIELFSRFPGPVLDCDDIRRDPRKALSELCNFIGLEFSDSMLSWPPGPKSFDGAWAPHWYGAVHKSTGFAGAEGALPDLSGALAELVEAALPSYEKLASVRMD